MTSHAPQVEVEVGGEFHLPAPAVVETHLSWVLFLGDHVYKLKRPVRTAFLDLSTVQRRQEICAREVELNRRLAPDVYRGVATVRGPDGLDEPMVVMQRMPEQRRLTCLLDSPEAPVLVDSIAARIAEFHRGATRSAATDAAAMPAAVEQLWVEGITQLHELSAGVVGSELLDEIDSLARRFLHGRKRLFQDRAEAGRSIDGHGDLLADDVFLLADGPRVLDCLEFEDRFRFGDMLADVAFLAMDLERLGHPALAMRFLTRHRELTGDDWPVSLAHWWTAYRACVRAKVACIRHRQGDASAASSAQQHLQLALGHLRAGEVRLVLVGGAPGTGKSTLSEAVAQRTGWQLLRSDVVRQEQHATQTYTPEAKSATYARMLELARTLLERGESVLLDATWGEAAQRAQAESLAASTHSGLQCWQTTAPADVVAARVRQRTTLGTDVSEADESVAAELARRFEPWPEATVVETSNGVDAAVERLAGETN